MPHSIKEIKGRIFENFAAFSCKESNLNLVINVPNTNWAGEANKWYFLPPLRTIKP